MVPFFNLTVICFIGGRVPPLCGKCEVPPRLARLPLTGKEEGVGCPSVARVEDRRAHLVLCPSAQTVIDQPARCHLMRATPSRWYRPAPLSGMSVRALSLALAVLFAGCVATPEGGDGDGQGLATLTPIPDNVLALLDAVAASPEVRFETDHGTIRWLLYMELVPQTSQHVSNLIEDGFYTDTLIHRVVDDFVIQGGDRSGTGQLASGSTVPLETHPNLPFVAGSIGMARDVDPDSGDSQWFITERPQPHLDSPRGPSGDVFGAYAQFGQVFEGMDVVRSIAAVPTVPGADRPIEDVYLQSAELLPPPTDIDLLAFPPDFLGRLEWSSYAFELVAPHHVFAGHPLRLTITVEPLDDAAQPPTALLVGNTTLGAVEDDPWVYEGVVTMDEPGDAAFEIYLVEQEPPGSGPVATFDVIVLGWHSDLCRYAQGSDTRCPALPEGSSS